MISWYGVRETAISLYRSAMPFSTWNDGQPECEIETVATKRLYHCIMGILHIKVYEPLKYPRKREDKIFFRHIKHDVVCIQIYLPVHYTPLLWICLFFYLVYGLGLAFSHSISAFLSFSVAFEIV